MIHEIATLTIDPARVEAFQEAVAAAYPFFAAAPGCRSFALERSIEHPERFFLVVGWDTVEAHMVGFRASEGFQRWRELASPFFVAPPSVEHVRTVVRP